MKPRTIKRTLLATVIAATSTQSLAAGFQLNAQSATGIGRAFAGDAVIADNASVMARNAAAMALFDKTQLSLGFETIITDIKVSNANYTGITGATQNSNYSNAGGTSIAPNIHLIVPVNEQFALGVNAYSNFGTKTEFGNSFVAKEYGGLTDVKNANIGIAGSYRANEQVSFGAGLDIVYGQGSIVRKHDLLGDLVNVNDATGWAIGFNVGTVVEVNENNRFGLAYRYSPEIEAEDEEGQTITLPLPSMVEFSGYHALKNTDFALHYSVQYIGWGVFDEIGFDNLKDSTLGSTYNKEYEWQTGMHYAIGGTYYVNDKFTLRAGYMYDTSAQDQVKSISVPDSDRQWFSGGFTYHLSNHSNVDFGFTYLVGEEVEVSEITPHPAIPGANISEISGTTRANAILVGLQYSHSF
ncbi:outer membrane protein transport protein [Vibrio owensii]|uniref:outer membrane protein transport protein n=1 Tax=Vibrio owensii TaxID=696485 RepID=UPI0018F1BA56|nr:outer membrane protein transport protein [Vibrio owensii]